MRIGDCSNLVTETYFRVLPPRSFGGITETVQRRKGDSQLTAGTSPDRGN